MNRSYEERLIPPIIFDNLGLIASGIMLAVGLYYREELASLLAFLVLVVILSARVFSRHALKNVVCDLTMAADCVFPGEGQKVEISVSNNKLLPLGWLELELDLPPGLSWQAAIEDDPDTIGGQRQLTARWHAATSLLWYGQAVFPAKLFGLKRGVHKIKNMRVTTGDIFGIYERVLDVPLDREVVVYPRLFPVGTIKLPALHPLGNRTTNNRVFADPLFPIGVREYTGDSPLKHINWKASARTGVLQQYVFQPTMHREFVLIFPAEGFPAGIGEDVFEEMVSATASVAVQALLQGWATGLFCNCQVTGGVDLKIPPAGGHDQAARILDGLARLSRDPLAGLEELNHDIMPRLKGGTVLIIFCAGWSHELEVTVMSWSAAVSQTLMITADDQLCQLPGIISYPVSSLREGVAGGIQ